MVDLTREVGAFERELPLLRQRFGKESRWVVFLDEELRGDFPSFDAAFDFSMRLFPDRDFMIRNIQPEKLELPFLLVVA